MRPAALLGGAVTLVLALGACSSESDLTAERARALQADVLAVTTAAAAGNWEAVDDGITAARADLDAGLDAGDLSTARYREIDAALDRVAAEADAADAAQDRAAAVAKAKATAAAKAKATATATPTQAASPTAPAAKTPAAPTKGKGEDDKVKGPGSKHPPKPKKGK